MELLGFNFVKQGWWERAVIAGFTVHRPDVGSGPYKTVTFCQNNPRALVIESQAPFGGSWDFNVSVRRKHFSGVARWNLKAALHLIGHDAVD
ncbi:hypothetical protein DSM25559_4984 [Agrobacterium rosae]|uniref:Uncharacterized protein n=1 Tax=Agrobacterium rosae TaxID=1972867 RepID=A0A1R3U2M6_9HYPH|nr:hypothetical protein DSM25559_4984 [Agrobacterium rosae]